MCIVCPRSTCVTTQAPYTRGPCLLGQTSNPNPTPLSSAQGVCKLACSEEVPEVVEMGGSGFSVAFDPLDGSSIVDTNFTVGTIFGVWPGDKLDGITGRQQVRAAAAAEVGAGVMAVAGEVAVAAIQQRPVGEQQQR